MEESASDKSSTRIHHHSSPVLSLLLGLLAMAALGAGAYWFTHRAAEKVKTTHYDQARPIPSDAELKRTLKEEQYHVVRENGTEPAFQNLYFNNLRVGLYVDIISGQPLFTSLDKFDNQNGRPNFTKPIAPELIEESRDTSFGLERTEVHAAKSKAHLGHLFRDGPAPGGLRYTVNSAALRFIPLEKLEVEGYGDYLSLFPSASPSPAPSN